MSIIPKAPSEQDIAFFKSCIIDLTTGEVFNNAGRNLAILYEGRYRIKAVERVYRRSHIIWWKATGRWPTQLVDHKNRNSMDDCITNLRELPFRDNILNSFRSDRDLPPGVYLAPKHNNKSKYIARIFAGSRPVHLGMFSDWIEASERVEEAIDNLAAYGPDYFNKPERPKKELPIGVHRHPANKKRPYKAKGWLQGKEVHLGYYASPEEAHQAYLTFQASKT